MKKAFLSSILRVMLCHLTYEGPKMGYFEEKGIANVERSRKITFDSYCCISRCLGF